MADASKDIELTLVTNGSAIDGTPTSTTTTAVNLAEEAQRKKNLTGSWLCTEGPYQRYIAALSNSVPGLKYADPNNKQGPLKVGNALVVLLDAPATGQPNFQSKEFVNIAELRTHFQNTTHDHDHRRIYIMEGLAPDYVSLVGGHFFMEPTFFLRQERTCVWSNDFTPVSDALPHLSLLNPDKSFHLQYCELRQFNKAVENRYYFCERTRRHCGMTAPRHQEETTTGILRRKVSWWSRITEKGGWDVVILCDPQLVNLSPKPKVVIRDAHDMYALHTSGKISDEQLENFPHQDGYVDFIPIASHDQITNKKGHCHISMLRDLRHYYEQHADLLAIDDWNTPVPSSIFLKKIVTAHYLQLADYIKVMLPSLELRLMTGWVEEQDQWRSLQTISRRCGNYRDDIEDALLSLGFPLDGKLDAASKLRSTDWKDCEKDLQYAYFRLKILKERADNLMSAMTGLASIAGNRQNLEEAKRLKRLNILALLFIPLAYTCSLFSMQAPFAPGTRLFYVYWITALGVVLATAATTWILDSALDEEAQWKWRPKWYLKFWARKKRMPGGLNKERPMGFYHLKD